MILNFARSRALACGFAEDCSIEPILLSCWESPNLGLASEFNVTYLGTSLPSCLTTILLFLTPNASSKANYGSTLKDALGLPLLTAPKALVPKSILLVGLPIWKGDWSSVIEFFLGSFAAIGDLGEIFPPPEKHLPF